MKLVRRSIRNVLRSPVRLILVVTLLGASLMFVAAMVSLDTSSQQHLAAVHQQIGTTITIQSAQPQGGGSGPSNGSGPGATPTPVTTGPGTGSIVGSSPSISNSIVAKVERMQGVVDTQVGLERPYLGNSLQSLASALPPIAIDGIPKNAASFSLEEGGVPILVAGRGFRDSDATADVAMMSQALAQKNQLHVGSTILLNGTSFTLIGLYTTSSQFTDNSLVIPLATLQQLFHLTGVDSLVVTAASPQQVEAVAARLRSLLGPQFKVIPMIDTYNSIFNALQVAQNSIEAGLAAALLIAAIIIVFAVLMLVRERTAEIAILKTVGASHMQVLRQFWIEILALSLMAAGLASLLLVTLGSFLSHFFDVDASALMTPATNGPSLVHPLVVNQGGTITGTTSGAASTIINAAHLPAATLNAQTLLIILGVGIGLALLTSLIPTWFVAQLKPAQVLRKAQ